MKTKVIQYLLACSFALVGSISFAQERQADAQEKAKTERAIDLQRRAAARAAAEHSRAADRALEVQRRAAAKAAAESTRAAMRVYRQHERAAARALAETKRMQRRMNQIHAQEKRRLDGFKFHWSRPTIDIKNIVKGAPYSAKAVTEHTQTLSDGNQIIHRNEALYYRDSEGRLRIEQTLKTIGKWAAQDEPPKIITIYDPVSGTYYSLNPSTRTAVKDPSGTLRMKMKEMQKIETQHLEKLKNDMKIKMSDPPKDREKYEDSPKTKTKLEQPSDSRRKKETLGQQTIEGVVAEGTRTTRTIPAGEIGNVRPIEVIDERWYSTELQLHILTKHQDPRSGETIYRLTNINRREQDRSLFEVPSDYRIVDKFSYRSPNSKL
ncbi:MAG TPA: hypothetical protein VJM12_05165 [Pyrinomonadaceae bacterium]|nr:hypothetical protein [Pyrinomonadaceae bacterium]